MNGKYFLTDTIKPVIDKVGNVAFTSDDVLFDWISFEIPRGTCALKSLFAVVQGTAGAAGNERNIDLLFAKSVAGVAPPTLGDSNDAADTIKTATIKPHLIGYYGINGSEMGDTGDGLVSYNVLGNGIQSASNKARETTELIIQGESTANGGSATQGFQTIYIAGIAQGNFDFGTDVLVAGAHSADDLTIVVDGSVGGDDVFTVGDTITAFKNDGSEPKVIGNLTAVADNLLTVDAAPVILPDDHEICNLNPITFRFGFEY
jgi:hypothetical protein|tara:strand:+ start:43 stop:825 length:783 start_codon:yes stop_codon:yes gene_type:complete